MGGRGNSGSRASGSANSEATQKTSVSTLNKYLGNGGIDQIKKDFNLGFATRSQLIAIRNILAGMVHHDTGYDENKTPFLIDTLRITKSIEDNEFFKDKTISFFAQTVPDTDNLTLQYLDQKDRIFMIGRNGGFYTYNRNGKRVRVSNFDAAYGSRHAVL